MAAIDLQHVPYKGTALAIPDIFNGQVALMFDNMVSAIPFIRSGKVKPIAVTSLRRSSILPELPTVSESGVPGYESVAYFGVFAPAGTPADVVARLNAEIVKIVHAAETKAKLADLGAEVEGSSPEAFAAIVKSEAAKWAKVIKDAGIRAE